jgi:hypothetical protein
MTCSAAVKIKQNGCDKMKRKNLVGLIAIVAITAVVLFAGCVEEETPVPTPSPTATPIQNPTPTPEELIATPTPEPTSTSTPEPTPEPITLSEIGQEATSKFSLEKGLSIFRMTHDGDSNFAIWLLDDEGDQIDLLVNEIGEFDGSKAVGIKNQGDYILDISADGSWTITIEQPRPSSAPSVPKTLKGKAQQASEVFYLDKGLARFEMSHDGDSNFAVWLLDDEGDQIDLLVNEIGEFDGSKAVSISNGGIYLLDITADGNWEISIE